MNKVTLISFFLLSTFLNASAAQGGDEKDIIIARIQELIEQRDAFLKKIARLKKQKRKQTLESMRAQSTPPIGDLSPKNQDNF